MSDVSEWGGTSTTRLSRRALRERAVELDAEKTATAPAPVVEAPPAPIIAEPAVAKPAVAEPIVEPARPVVPAPVVEAPSPIVTGELAPVSRVVRRCTTQMAPRRTQPPTPAVIQPAPTAPSPSGTGSAPVAPAPFAPVNSVVSSPALSHHQPVPHGVPPWEAITSGDEPITGGNNVVAPEVKAERHALRSDEAARVPPPGAGYTWLQYLILVAVAFVLGLLLWQLIIGELPIPHIGANLLAPNYFMENLL